MGCGRGVVACRGFFLKRCLRWRCSCFILASRLVTGVGAGAGVGCVVELSWFISVLVGVEVRGGLVGGLASVVVAVVWFSLHVVVIGGVVVGSVAGVGWELLGVEGDAVPVTAAKNFAVDLPWCCW